MESEKRFICHLEAPPDENPEFCLEGICCGIYRQPSILLKVLWVIVLVFIVAPAAYYVYITTYARDKEDEEGERRPPSGPKAERATTSRNERQPENTDKNTKVKQENNKPPNNTNKNTKVDKNNKRVPDNTDKNIKEKEYGSNRGNGNEKMKSLREDEKDSLDEKRADDKGRSNKNTKINEDDGKNDSDYSMKYLKEGKKYFPDEEGADKKEKPRKKSKINGDEGKRNNDIVKSLNEDNRDIPNEKEAEKKSEPRSNSDISSKTSKDSQYKETKFQFNVKKDQKIHLLLDYRGGRRNTSSKIKISIDSSSPKSEKDFQDKLSQILEDKPSNLKENYLISSDSQSNGKNLAKEDSPKELTKEEESKNLQILEDRQSNLAENGRNPSDVQSNGKTIASGDLPEEVTKEEESVCLQDSRPEMNDETTQTETKKISSASALYDVPEELTEDVKRFSNESQPKMNNIKRADSKRDSPSKINGDVKGKESVISRLSQGLKRNSSGNQKPINVKTSGRTSFTDNLPKQPSKNGKQASEEAQPKMETDKNNNVRQDLSKDGKSTREFSIGNEQKVSGNQDEIRKNFETSKNDAPKESAADEKHASKDNEIKDNEVTKNNPKQDPLKHSEYVEKKDPLKSERSEIIGVTEHDGSNSEQRNLNSSKEKALQETKNSNQSDSYKSALEEQNNSNKSDSFKSAFEKQKNSNKSDSYKSALEEHNDPPNESPAEIPQDKNVSKSSPAKDVYKDKSTQKDYVSLSKTSSIQSNRSRQDSKEKKGSFIRKLSLGRERKNSKDLTTFTRKPPVPDDEA